MRCNRRAARALRVFFRVALFALAGCVHLPADPGPAPPSPLPAGRRALFALSPRDEPVGFRKTLLSESDDSALFRVDLFPGAFTGEPLVSFEWREPARFTPPWPAVLVAPILKGGYVLEHWVADVLSEEGIAVAIPLHSEDPLPAISSPEDLGEEFLRSVRAARAVVDWMEARESVDPSRLGSVGTSLGALRNVVLLAGEPRLRANLLALGGLDVAYVFDHSREASVAKYRRERAALEGVDPSSLSRRFRDAFFFHDEATARAVDGRTVLLVLARFDSAIPIESGLSLREALGRPETRVVPFAHYSTLLALPAIRVWMVEFFRRRFGTDGDPGAAPPIGRARSRARVVRARTNGAARRRSRGPLASGRGVRMPM